MATTSLNNHLYGGQSVAPLLLSSNFCRSRRSKKFHVTVHILSTAVSTRHRKKTRTQKKRFSSYTHDDSHVFVSHELMVALSLQQGDIAWLSNSSSDGTDDDSTGDVYCPVVACLRHEEEDEQEKQQQQQQEWKEKEESDDKNSHYNDDSNTIQVSPTMAASIGCFDDGCKVWLSTQQQQQMQEPQEQILRADVIEVKQIGHPVQKFHFLRQQKNVNPLNLLSRQSSRKLLLSHSSLISAMNDDPDNHDEELFFFEIVSINQSLTKRNYQNDGNRKQQRYAYETSHATHWKIVKGSSSCRDTSLERRLPCLSQTRRFYQSTKQQPKRDSDLQTITTLPCCHPSVNDAVKSLSFPTHVEASQRIVHVTGTEENHVGKCIETAADQLGMRYLGVNGLAAYAYASGEDVSSGSLIDQLAGLKAAMKDAASCAPCVLHLVDFHLELNHSDEEHRHQQEQRFWTTIVEALDVSPGSSVMMPSTALSIECYTHKVLVVISTEHSLSVGPLLENFVHSPLTINIPDEAYTKQLWHVLEEDILRDFILGRSAEEILHIKNLSELKYKEMIQNNDAVTDTASSIIQSICQEVDGRKTKITANIPDIHWEDVGGLEHVRQEIMDAIELPLKHRNLFPHSGRSGILLYGPPGTGKTLIAKAVATECNLPFLSVKGPELLGSYVGESEANIRATFASAREAATNVGGGLGGGGGAAILFFDELDSLAPRRGGVGDGGGVMERVVATLCAEFDGKKQQTHDDTTSDGNGAAEPIVFVIGATNRPDLLDPSLLRPGRLDRLVYLGQANKKENRAQILAALMRNFKFEHDQDAMSVALQVVDQLPQSMTGADFSAIASGALQLSLHRLCDEVELEVNRRLEEGTAKQSPLPGDDMPTIDVDYVLNEWDDDQLVPIVTATDLLEAGKKVVPSVSAEELAGYEALRVQFSTS